MRRQKLAGALLALVVISTGVVAAVHITNTVPVNGTIPIQTQSGTTVYVPDHGGEIRLANPWINSTAVDVTTEAGNATVVQQSSGAAELTLTQIEGQETVIDNLDVSGTRVYVNPDDKAAIEAAGGIKSLSVKQSPQLDDGTPDLRYSAESPGTIGIGGLPADTGVGIINQSSGSLLATDETGPNGRAEFRKVPSGDADLLVQKSPQSLFIRPEPDSSEQITNVSVTIRFFEQGKENEQQIVTRTTSDGQIEMTGLPKNESFVVNADADGFTSRRVFVDNLFEQESVYLLSDTDAAVTKIFDYSDFSGSFPQEDTVLKIQRPVDGRFVTMQGDVIGATGEYRVTLAENVRHRLVVLNTVTGERRVEGAYTPVTDGTQAIEIYSNNDIDIASVGPLLSFSPSVGAVPAAENTFEVSIRERDSPIESATVIVYERDSSGLTQLTQKSVSSSSTISQSANFTGSTGTAVVQINYKLVNGREGTRYSNYSVREQYNNPNSVLSVLGGFGSLLPEQNVEGFQAVVALMTSVIFAAGAASRSRLSGSGFGMIVTAVLAGWSVIGWVSYGIVFASGAGVAALVFLRRGL